MNFDTDDDTDFSLSPQSSSNNKLASLFKLGAESNSSATNESLKYKAPKQPQQQQQAPTQQQQAQTSAAQQMMFFSHVQAFKYLNNRYEPQGKLGLVILSSQNTYKLVLYVVKTQPTALIKLTSEFKIALQKNNYASFYDDTRQLWSILFENEDSIVSFATQITLCKCNLMGSSVENVNLSQELRVNGDAEAATVESGDSIEIETLVTVCKDLRLGDVLENTQQKPFRVRLGKNKLPKRVEDLIINMRQNERKLFVLAGNSLAPFYSNSINASSIVFYDISILKIKKNDHKERTASTLTAASVSNDSMPLPQLTEPESPARSRAESVKDKTKIINDQLNDSKLEKAKLISRMARMGQPILHQMTNQGGVITGVEDEDWETQQHQLQQQQQQLNSMNETAAAKTAFLLQQQQQQQQQQQFLQLQQQQQQLAFQNQLLQSNNLIQTPNNSQLALFKSPTPTQSPQLIIYPQQQAQPTLVEPVKPGEQSILNKLEIINDKIDNLKQITQINNQNMPSMETNILLQNIQRIVKENEQYKKDLYDKSAKIEEQNAKITELLMKAQNYVEQSHQILELKNSAFQTNAEKTVNKVLELEQDKMRLTQELSKLTAQISELNLDVNKMQKQEADLKQQLVEVSKNTDMHKQQSERLLVENADLQTKLDTIGAEYKKERQLRKSLETKINLNDEELNELRTNLTSTQRSNEEKKRKYELDKAQFDRELEELKLAHSKEINELKERLSQFKTKGTEMQSEQAKQIEFDLNREWQAKLDKTVQQCELKYQRLLGQLNEEKEDLMRQLNESKETVKQMKFNISKYDSDNEGLKQKLDDSNLIREKYERLQQKALQMKETYDARIKELLDAEPDAEVIAEELKKVMNLIYKLLKKQIKLDEYYAGNGILSAMLKIIKMYTLRILQPSENDNEDEQEDYFSLHVYKPPEPVLVYQQQQSISIASTSATIQNETPLSQPVQVIVQEEAALNKMKAYDQVDTDLKVKTTDMEMSKLVVNEAKSSIFQSSSENSKMLFSQMISGSNNDDEDEDEDDDDRSIQLINEDDQVETKSNELKPEDEVKQDSEQREEEEEEREEAKNEEIKVEVDEPKEEEEEEEDKTSEFDLYSEKKIAVESIGQISPLNEDLVEENKVVLEETENVSKLNEETILRQSPPPLPETTEESNEDNQKDKLTSSVDIAKSVKKSKGLFDDDDDQDDENDKLFSFTSKTNDTNASLMTASTMNKNEKESTMTSSNINNTTTTTATSVNLKFSPPPLFDNDDESNENIDWFK